jgi:hypothetical protein
MVNLKIRIFTSDKEKPKTTISVPLGILKIASKIMPKKLVSVLADKGLDVNEVLKAVMEEDIRGVLAEIEEHHKNETIIISIE